MYIPMTAPREIQKVLCRHCQAVVDLGDNFCRHCGAPLGAAATDSAVPGTAPPDRFARRPIRPASRGALLVALFVVLGPVALPMLWRSPRFSPRSKIILTILVAIQTVAVVWLVWYVLHLYILEPLERIGALRGL
jgi:ribosomal protein L40E